MNDTHATDLSGAPAIRRTFDDAIVRIVRNQLGRRNLTDAARIRVAVRFRDMVEAEAKQRQLATLKQGNSAPVVPKSAERANGETRDKLADLAGGRYLQLSQNFAKAEAIETRKELADAADTSRETYRKGEFILDNAPEAIKAKVLCARWFRQRSDDSQQPS